MFAHMLELQHETLHGTAFRGRRRNVIAGIVLGLPLLVSFSAYQVSHLRHHRDLGTPDNQEFFDYGDQYGAEEGSRLRTAGLWIYRLSLVAHYKQFLRTLGRVLTGRAPADESPLTQRRIRRDYLVITGVLAASVLLSVLTGSFGILWAWLVPMAVVGMPAHALIELPEHFRCDTETQDVLENSRTITSNFFMAWLANTNNFHVEHHLMPNLPFRRLSGLHRDVAPSARFFQPSYYAFFRALTSGELRRVR
jgi:fatty acid desaturase